MAIDVSLPQGFEALESFVADRALRKESERQYKRLTMTPEEHQEFYREVMPHMGAIIEYLKTKTMDSLTAQDERLLNLTLSIIETGLVVDLFDGLLDSPLGIPFDKMQYMHELRT